MDKGTKRNQSPLVEGKDYYLSSDGLHVFTKEFLLKRGFCCQSGCLHCPFDQDFDSDIPAELNTSEKNIDQSVQEYLENTDLLYDQIFNKKNKGN